MIDDFHNRWRLGPAQNQTPHVIPAADEITRLHEEVERLEHRANNDMCEINRLCDEIEQLRAEVERLRAANVRLQEAIDEDPIDQSQEIERLRDRLVKLTIEHEWLREELAHTRGLGR